MKYFSQFIIESRGSRASEKAKNLNLISDGKGRWLNKAGEVVAQTVKGDLVMLKKKSPSPEKAAPSLSRSPAERPTPEPPTAAAPRVGIASPKEAPPAPEVEREVPVTIVFGRFNPPTAGHEKLLKKAKEVSSGGDLMIFPSRTQDAKKNPLEPAQKIKYMRKLFPEFKDNIINKQEMRTIFDVLLNMQEKGYNKVNIVVGSDRVSEFDRLSQQYNGKLYSFDELNVVPAGNRDPDAVGVEGTSASKLRKAAVEDDYGTFRAGLPIKTKEDDARALFFAVQRIMQGRKLPEPEPVQETWEYAPKLDSYSLREQYYQEKIFKVGDIVENLNTGFVGKVTRRGPNYVICVTENSIMFKSWIKDLKEWTDQSGVPADQREVGTDALRNYAMRMTGTEEILNFYKNFKKSKKTK